MGLNCRGRVSSSVTGPQKHPRRVLLFWVVSWETKDGESRLTTPTGETRGPLVHGEGSLGERVPVAGRVGGHVLR